MANLLTDARARGIPEARMHTHTHTITVNLKATVDRVWENKEKVALLS